jgi:GDP-L-fucose synthase
MNILVTGANGFIGSNIINLLSDNVNFNFFKGTRNTIDLCSVDNIEKYINDNEINAVIHCAIEGGSRLKQDTCEMFYRNILMYENLIKFNDRYKVFINFGSGAEFDRRYDISNANEYDIFDRVPTDFYGLSKNIISKLSVHYCGSVNLRLFGCFYHNELPSRFIRNNINNYINDQPIVIHQDRYIDFFYMEDLINAVKYFLNNQIQPYKDINMSYTKKYKLSDIANIINGLSSKKVCIIKENDNLGLSYAGSGISLKDLNLPLIGLENGIFQCYEKLKNNLLYLYRKK